MCPPRVLQITCTKETLFSMSQEREKFHYNSNQTSHYFPKSITEASPLSVQVESQDSDKTDLSKVNIVCTKTTGILYILVIMQYHLKFIIHNSRCVLSRMELEDPVN